MSTNLQSLANTSSKQAIAVLLAVLSFLVVVFMSGGAWAQPAPNKDNPHSFKTAVIGEWTPPDMDAVISIRDCEGELCADLIQHDYANLATTDVNNPNPIMRTRQLLGIRILDGLRRAKDGVWKGGKLYDPRTGKTYISRLKFLDHDRLKITGCVAPGLCKGYVWKRFSRASIQSGENDFGVGGD